MAEDFDIEALLEAPYNVSINFKPPQTHTKNSSFLPFPFFFYI